MPMPGKQHPVGRRSAPKRLGAVLVAACSVAAPLLAQGKVDFMRDVQPILSDRCFLCHGPDASKRKAGLRLDVRDAALQRLPSGRFAIVPGKLTDQCMYGPVTKGPKKSGLISAKKPTQFLTNPPCIAQQLQRRCPGKDSHSESRRASLFAGRAKKAQTYPEALCEAICLGVKEQIQADKEGRFHLCTVSLDEDGGVDLELDF